MFTASSTTKNSQAENTSETRRGGNSEPTNYLLICSSNSLPGVYSMSLHIRFMITFGRHAMISEKNLQECGIPRLICIHSNKYHTFTYIKLERNCICLNH